MKLYNIEAKVENVENNELVEAMKLGYAAMAKINLEIAGECAYAEHEAEQTTIEFIS